MLPVVFRSGLSGGFGNYQRVLYSLAKAHKSDLATTKSAAPAASSDADQLAIIDKAHDIFYGPERDFKNFPTPRQPEECTPCRVGIIPDKYFQMMYPKTGVTGPYLVGVGTIAYLLSKEWWVIDHDFSEFLAFWALIWGVHYKYGDKISQIVEDMRKKKYDASFVHPLEKARNIANASIKAHEDAIKQTEGEKYLFEAKKENVDLQLEAAYRQRIQTVYNAVKSRLDYQVEVVNTRKRFEQEHMVNWIVEGVRKSITPQLEKDAIAGCLQTLKKLSTA